MEGCPLTLDNEHETIPARCRPCVQSALRMPGTTVAVDTKDYDQEQYPCYAQDYVREALFATEDCRNRRHVTERGVFNPDDGSIIQVESKEYIAFRCPRT